MEGIVRITAQEIEEILQKGTTLDAKVMKKAQAPTSPPAGLSRRKTKRVEEITDLQYIYILHIENITYLACS